MNGLRGEGDVLGGGGEGGVDARALLTIEFSLKLLPINVSGALHASGEELRTGPVNMQKYEPLYGFFKSVSGRRLCSRI